MRLAKAFEGQKIGADADNQMVQFTAGDEKASKLLETLTKEKLLDVEDWEEDGEDEEASEDA